MHKNIPKINGKPRNQEKMSLNISHEAALDGNVLVLTTHKNFQTQRQNFSKLNFSDSDSCAIQIDIQNSNHRLG